MTEFSTVEYRLTIHDMPADERPRERLRAFGAASLSNAELLAIILRVGTGKENVLALASRMLARFEGLAGLSKAAFSELCSQRGVGEAKAAQIKAALELGKRLVNIRPEERALIQSPQDAANLLIADMGFLEQEHLRVLLLDTRNRLVSIQEVYKGSVNSAQIRVSEVFREAVRHNCPAIIVAHNHPSGDPAPSSDDVAVTEQLIAGGKTLDIEVLDHLVIAHQKYVSLREHGLAFK